MRVPGEFAVTSAPSFVAGTATVLVVWPRREPVDGLPQSPVDRRHDTATRFSRGADRQQEDALSASWPPSAAWRSCVQPLMSAWARRAEDLSFDKTDDKDAVPIAQLAAQLRCYLPRAG
jgi:hypothetical protein